MATLYFRSVTRAMTVTMTTALNSGLRKAIFDIDPSPAMELVASTVKIAPLPAVKLSSFPPDFSSLEDILKRADRSNSWAYQHGLVPKYELDGREIKSTKRPPWPWEVLPHAVVKNGKKAWLTSEIDRWLDRISLRASLDSRRATDGMSGKEHAHD
jgi:hypothetical protein